MINDFKFGLKVIKYGLNVKGCLICSVIFLLMGMLMDFGVPNAPINGLYVGMGGMMIVQMICSVSVSTMVQSSVYKRQLQTSVPVIVGGVYLLLGNTISIIVKFAGMKVLEWSLADVANGIVFNTILMVIMVLYMGGAMKAFWIATVCFFVFYFTFFSLASSVQYMEGVTILPVEVAVILSYVMIIVVTVLMYFLFVAMYKYDFSKQNFETQLKRAK